MRVVDAPDPIDQAIATADARALICPVSPRSQAQPFTVKHFRQWARRLELDNGNQWDTEDFQEAFLEDLFSGIPEIWFILPEGNAKTTLFAGVALYHAEHKRSANVSAAASSRDQVGILYDQGDGFIVRSGLRGFTLHPGYRRISFRAMMSRVQFMAADDRTGDGTIPTLALLEELHRHRDMRLYRVLRGKLIKRSGQLGAISTRGEPGSEFELTLERIKEEATTTEVAGSFTRAASKNLILHEWAVPRGADVEDMAVVKAANPLKAITVDMLAEKRASPTMTLAHWQRFVCNLPTRDVENWLGPNGDALWRNLVEPYALRPGAPTYIGVDMAKTRDTTAVVLIQRRDDGRYHAICRIWVPYEGHDIDVTDVMQHIREAAKTYKVQAVSFDPAYFDLAAKMLQSGGLNMIEVPQSVPRMTTIVGDTYAAIMRGQITHDGDENFTRQVLNAVPRYNERAFTLEKSKSHGKIDAAIALCLAYDQALRHQTKARPALFVGAA